MEVNFEELRKNKTFNITLAPLPDTRFIGTVNTDIRVSINRIYITVDAVDRNTAKLVALNEMSRRGLYMKVTRCAELKLV